MQCVSVYLYREVVEVLVEVWAGGLTCRHVSRRWLDNVVDRRRYRRQIWKHATWYQWREIIQHGSSEEKLFSMVPVERNYSTWFQWREIIQHGSSGEKLFNMVPVERKYSKWYQLRENIPHGTSEEKIFHMVSEEKIFHMVSEEKIFHMVPAERKYSTWYQRRENQGCKKTSFFQNQKFFLFVFVSLVFLVYNLKK